MADHRSHIRVVLATYPNPKKFEEKYYKATQHNDIIRLLQYRCALVFDIDKRKKDALYEKSRCCKLSCDRVKWHFLL